MPTPTVLFYAPALPSWPPKLRQLCALQGLRLRIVESAHLDRPLLSLLSGGAAGEGAPGHPLPEPVMVLCHLSGPQLDKLLLSLRKIGAKGCLKAVLTPTNAGWTLRQLYGELSLEREGLASHPPQG